MTENSLFSLKGKKILITGASSGIGSSVAKLASEQGAMCIINGRNEERLNQTFKCLTGEGHIAIVSDLKEGNGTELVKKAVVQTGLLNGFVHCAGIEKTLPFRATQISDLREIMHINLEVFWVITQELLKSKNHEKEKLSVVGISSIAALFGAPGNTAYAASKGALISLIKSLAAEYASKQIRFNAVCPGYVETPMLDAVKKFYRTEEEFVSSIASKHPLGLGSPEDVANAAVYLLSDASRWVTGSAFNIDGGYGIR
ncbi:MAG: SDR family oxidoreductase [Synergistota bacterium]|nr:SDR family oxidoreductase [Synergistota bacterium]